MRLQDFNSETFGSRLYGRACLAWYSHPALIVTLAVLVSIVVLFLVPLCAFGDVDETLDILLENPAASMFYMAIDNLNSISVGSITKSFSELFSDDAFSVVQDMARTVTQICGYSVLAIVYLVQLARMAAKFDSNATMPGVTEVLFLLFFFVIFKHLIDHSLEYCELIYNFFNEITKAVAGVGADGSIALGVTIDPDEAMLNWVSKMESAGVIVQFFAGLVIWATSGLLMIIAYVSVLGRSLQAYMLAIFSPIPLAMLGADETRQWGIGYIKNFLAICLAGAIIMIIIIMFPYILSAANAMAPEHAFAATIAACLLGILALSRAGAWARDLLGG